MALNKFLVLLISGGIMFAVSIISSGRNKVSMFIGLVSYFVIFIYMTYLAFFGKISFRIFNTTGPLVISFERVVIFLISGMAMSFVAGVVLLTSEYFFEKAIGSDEN